MSNKIGIVTIFDINYGNRLQCYALQEAIKMLGYDAENIFNGYRPYTRRHDIFLHCVRLFLPNRNEWAKARRVHNFNQFDKYIKYSPFVLEDNNHNEISDSYKKFIVGSDQVWNPIWMGKDIDFLTFAEESKRNSFSASFGVESIPEQHSKRYQEYLLKFDNISVREESGAEIVEKLTGRKATVTVDPTMLLSDAMWREKSKRPKRVKEGYILTYFLSPKCDEARELIEKVRGTREVYEIMDIKDKVAGISGPSEFLWLFDHADIVMTDSFHACVFSFLFDKPFVVFDRNWDKENMNTRLESFLSKFSLKRKYAGSNLENDVWEHDYSEGYEQLEVERKKAMAYLSNILEQ